MRCKIILLLVLTLFFADFASAQISYTSSIKKFQQNYVRKHEVVKKKDRKYFRFFPVHSDYKVEAVFARVIDTVGFIMPTSGTKAKKFFHYGELTFTLHQQKLTLTLFQNEQFMSDSLYKNHLFLPFTDLTSGEESYGGGRYIDLVIKDVNNNTVIIDFNKAYNPYCVYSKGYNCPIPPRENNLPVAINAGEMDFAKKLH